MNEIYPVSLKRKREDSAETSVMSNREKVFVATSEVMNCDNSLMVTNGKLYGEHGGMLRLPECAVVLSDISNREKYWSSEALNVVKVSKIPPLNNKYKECSVLLDDISKIYNDSSGALHDEAKLGESNLIRLEECSVVLEDITKKKTNRYKRKSNGEEYKDVFFMNDCQALKRNCFVVLKDILKMKNCSVMLHKMPNPLSTMAFKEITEWDYLTSDHINKFQEILALETNFRPRNVLFMWLPENIKPVKIGKHIQILPAAPTTDITHWVCTYFDGNMLKVYDSKGSHLTSHQVNFLHKLFPKKPRIVYEEVQKQLNNHDCGVFAIAFSVSLALGRDPSKENFDPNVMRSHLVRIFSTHQLEPFPPRTNIRRNNRT